MKICLVTDRRRLGQALEIAPNQWLDCLREQVVAAAAAGVDLIQVREPDLEAIDLSALVRSLADSTRGTATRILVNDRVDVALAAGASGVHLKESGFLPEVARRMVPAGFLIGCSVHSVEAAAARRFADYLIAGTVRPTASKRGVETLSEDRLKAIVTAAAGQPVLAIGGLDVDAIPLVRRAGTAGLAAVGAFIPPAGERVSEFVKKRVTELRFALATASPGT